MAFAPIGPVVDKVIEKSVEFVPVIGPGLKYVKTAKKITKFTNPVKATTYTAGMLIEIFEKVNEISNLTIEPEILYDSTEYCTKNETRKAGPFYVGTDSYRKKMTPMTLKLRQW